METPPTVGASERRTLASVADHDAEIAAALPQGDRLVVRRALAGPLITIEAGARKIGALNGGQDCIGAYIVSGVLVRATHVGQVALPELLGPGEIVAPLRDHDGTVPAREAVTAVEKTTCIVLGRSTAQALSGRPEILEIVVERMAAQRSRATTLGAIAQLPNVDLRLLAVLWHIAETWGRVGRDGCVVPFPLTHQMLGWFVAAGRPTVSLAMKRLGSAGLVSRCEDGTWLLAPGSSEALRTMLDVDGARPDMVLRARATRQRAQELQDQSAAVRSEAQQAGRKGRARRSSRR